MHIVAGLVVLLPQHALDTAGKLASYSFKGVQCKECDCIMVI